jgi:glycine oxidase
MAQPDQPLHAVVLGAGLMGRLLAFEWLRRGHRLSLYDAAGPDAQGSAARVAAAMLAPLAESAVTEPAVVAMGQYSLTRWPQLLAALAEPVFFQQAGTLIVWHRQDAPEATRFSRQLDATCQRNSGLAKPQMLDAVALAELEPGLSNRFMQGSYLPGEGQLDNRQLLDSLLHQIEAGGAELNWHRPRRIADFSVGQPGGPDYLFDCRGLGAQPDWQNLRGVRGEVIRVHAPEVTLRRPVRLIHPRYPLYIAPKPGGVFVIGATEIESEDMSPMTVRSALELLSAAYTVHSGFAEARILEMATQCRPTLPDNLPALRQLGPRTLQINGLYRHGFMIAPAMLDAAMEWADGGQTRLADSFPLRLESGMAPRVEQSGHPQRSRAS